MPNAVDLIPLGTASDDSHCFVFSVRSSRQLAGQSRKAGAFRRRAGPLEARDERLTVAAQRCTPRKRGQRTETKNRRRESVSGGAIDHSPNLGTDSPPGYIPIMAVPVLNPPKSILWVDDEGELLESHRIFLRSKGYEVEWATQRRRRGRDAPAPAVRHHAPRRADARQARARGLPRRARDRAEPCRS